MISLQEPDKLDLQRIALYSEDLNTLEPHISTLDITWSQVLKVASISSLLEAEMIKFWTLNLEIAWLQAKFHLIGPIFYDVHS